MSGRAESGTRSTRDVILDAAERRFAERGFAGVSVREIAADAGLKNQASLYHHFKNKRALYEAVLSRGLHPLIQVVVESGLAERAAPQGDYTFLDRMLDYLVEHKHLPNLIQRAGLDDSRYLRSVLNRMLRPFYAEGLAVLESVAGPWDPDELPHLAVGLYHLIFGYFANTALLDVVLQEDPQGTVALERQRHFLKVALSVLLGNQPVRSSTAKRQESA
jgi:AcrR family transcriptional regulator